MREFGANRGVRLIAFADYRHMAWKNGAGTTTQIAIFPADATNDDFGWRISMAVVNSSGPFSVFPGTDRTLVVLQGAGIDLAIAGQQAERLDRNSAPFTFAADTTTDAKLIDGPILDLNIMSLRDCFRHRVIKLSKPVEWTVTRGTIALFAWSAGLQINDGKQSIELKLGDTAILDDLRKLNIIPERSGDYYLVEFINI